MISKLSHLKDSLVVICNMIGQRTGMKVRYGAPVPTAMTDGKCVYIPAIKEDDAGARDLVIGFIDHEAAHLAETDFTLDRRHLTPLGKRLSNALEDIRIESITSTKWAGVNDNINRMLVPVIEGGMYGDPKDFSSPGSTVLMWLNARCRASMLHQANVVSFAEQIEETLEANMPGLAKILMPIALKVWNAPSTAVSIALAAEVVAALEKYQKDNEPPPPPPAEQDAQSEQDSEPNKDTDAPQSKPDDSDEAPDQQPQASDADGDQDEPQGDQAGDPSSTGSDDASDDQSDRGTDTQPDEPDAQDAPQSADGDQDDTGDAPTQGSDAQGNQNDPQAGQSAGARKAPPNAQAAANAAAAAAGGDELPSGDLGEVAAQQIVADPDAQEEFEAYQPLPITRFPATGPFIDATRANAESGRLKAQLINVIQASRWEHSYAASSGVRIDRTKLHRFGTGDSRIFRRSEHKRQLDTYVKILVDNSGSMTASVTDSKRRIDLAMEAAFASTVALQSIHRVTRSVSCFPGADGSSCQTLVEAGAHASAEMFSTTTAGCTPMAQALMAIAPEVCIRKEKRKIVIVKTDGDPDNIAAAKEVIDLYTRSGIEMIGVGMGPQSQGVRYLFDRSAVITDMNELPAALVQLLTATLSAAA